VIGEGFIHSIDEEVLDEFTHERDVDRPSQMIHINIITDRKEIRDPIEEMTFHEV